MSKVLLVLLASLALLAVFVTYTYFASDDSRFRKEYTIQDEFTENAAGESIKVTDVAAITRYPDDPDVRILNSSALPW